MAVRQKENLLLKKTFSRTAAILADISFSAENLFQPNSRPRPLVGVFNPTGFLNTRSGRPSYPVEDLQKGA